MYVNTNFLYSSGCIYNLQKKSFLKLLSQGFNWQEHANTDTLSMATNLILNVHQSVQVTFFHPLAICVYVYILVCSFRNVSALG